jgi:mannose-6-phosphate isomerase-like protein (cupin superfamily)
MPIQISNEQLSEGEQLVKVLGGGMSTKMVYGNEASLMIATRRGGYHSRPHVHDCEQINHVVSGELWIFVEDKAYHLKAGDFHRIPRNLVHWAWNPLDTPCTMIQVHAPALDPLHRRGAVGLFDEDEEPATDFRRSPRTIMASDDYLKIEEKYIGQRA